MIRASLLLPFLRSALPASSPPRRAESVVRRLPPSFAPQKPAALKTTIFSGGCFWGVEGVFSHVKGVTSAVSGYHGGTKATAGLQDGSSGRTGHAESVRVTYDPAKVRYDQLLRIFFSVIADPTELNHQGPDHGHAVPLRAGPDSSAEQRKVATAYLAQLRNRACGTIRSSPGSKPTASFYPAEAYHRTSWRRIPHHPYIRALGRAEGRRPQEALSRALQARLHDGTDHAL